MRRNVNEDKARQGNLYNVVNNIRVKNNPCQEEKDRKLKEEFEMAKKNIRKETKSQKMIVKVNLTMIQILFPSDIYNLESIMLKI